MKIVQTPQSRYVYNLLSRKEGDGDAIENTCIPTPQRQTVDRRCSIFFEEQNPDTSDDREDVWNQDTFYDTISLFHDSCDEPFKEKQRALSLAMNFDINMFSSYTDGRRASISLARLASEELDLADIAQPVSFDPTVDQSEYAHSRGEQLSRNAQIIDSPAYFTGTLAIYYHLLRRNLLEAIEKSTESRIVVERMNAKNFPKRRVIKRSQKPMKHLLNRY